MLDFSPAIFQKLLTAFLSNGYSVLTYQEYLANPTGKVLILRHDVDARPVKSLELARFEHNNGIKATYYFRAFKGGFDKNIIEEIVQLGHEIGYHYEDLYQQAGNYEKAIESFKGNLEKLRRHYPVTTICMDGHVFSPWNNHWLWKKYSYSDFNIKGEPYLDTDFTKVLYLTDTGRKWNATAHSLYDKVVSPYHYKYKTTFNILDDLEHGKLPEQIMINLHPQRWHKNKVLWLWEYVFQQIKNPVKYLIILFRKSRTCDQI